MTYFFIALKLDCDLPVNKAVAVESILPAQAIVEVNPASLRSNCRLVPRALHARPETTIEAGMMIIYLVGFSKWVKITTIRLKMDNRRK